MLDKFSKRKQSLISNYLIRNNVSFKSEISLDCRSFGSSLSSPKNRSFKSKNKPNLSFKRDNNQNKVTEQVTKIIETPKFHLDER